METARWGTYGHLCKGKLARDKWFGVLQGFHVRAKALLGAAGKVPQPLSAELIRPGIDLAGNARDLKGDVVRVGLPSGARSS